LLEVVGEIEAIRIQEERWGWLIRLVSDSQCNVEAETFNLLITNETLMKIEADIKIGGEHLRACLECSIATLILSTICLLVVFTSTA